MAATIAVVYPHMNAIGGDGFWLIREPERQAFGRSRPAASPAQARRSPPTGRSASTRFRRAAPKAALTVPGALGGWTLALELSRGARRPAAADAAARGRRARTRATAIPSRLRRRASTRDERRGADRRARLRRDLHRRGQAAEAGTIAASAAARGYAGPARPCRARRFLSRRRRAGDRRRSRAHRRADHARRPQGAIARMARAAVAAARRRRRCTTRPRRRKGSRR